MQNQFAPQLSSFDPLAPWLYGNLAAVIKVAIISPTIWVDKEREINIRFVSGIRKGQKSTVIKSGIWLVGIRNSRSLQLL